MKIIRLLNSRAKGARGQVPAGRGRMLHAGRRILSALVCLAMVLALLPAATFAAGSVTVSTLTELVAALGGDADTIIVTQTIELTAGAYDGHGKTVRVETPYLDESGVVVSNASACGVFNVPAGTNVTLCNMTVMGGRVSDQGALTNSGALIMENVTVTRSNRGIYNWGTLDMKDCNIVRNAALYGGGLLNRSLVAMDGCSLSENRSTRSSGGGGAAENSGSMFVNNSVIANNSSTEIGGAINNPYGSLYLMNTVVCGNVTTASGDNGGGIGLNGGNLYAVNSIFADNYYYDKGTAQFTSSDIGEYPDSFDNPTIELINCRYGSAVDCGDVLTATNTVNDTDDIFANYREDGVVIVTDTDTAQSALSAGFRHPALVAKGGNSYSLYAPLSATSPALAGGTITYFDFVYMNGNPYDVQMAYHDGTSTVGLGGLNTTDVEVTTNYEGGFRDGSYIGASHTGGAAYTVKLGAYEADKGSVTGASLYGNTYWSGATVTVTAYPNTGYALSGWTGAPAGAANSGNSCSFIVNADVEIAPVWATATQTITFDTHPQASTALTEENISASLTAAATVTGGGTPAYDWYACNAAGEITGASLYTGDTFAIPATLTAGTYYYLCQATLTGAAAVNSHVAQVSVSALSTVDDCYVNASGSDTSGTGEYNAPFQTLERAYSRVSDGGIVQVQSDLSLSLEVSMGRDKDITVKTADVDTSGTPISSAVTVRYDAAAALDISNGTVTFENIVLDGGAVWGGDVDAAIGRGTVNSGTSSRTKPLIQVSAAGAGVVLGQGCVLQNSAASSGGIAGVLAKLGSLTLSGGKIIDCIAAGDYTVYGSSGAKTSASAILVDYADFTFTSGEISGNDGYVYSTVTLFHNNDKTSAMSGGAVTRNRATRDGAGGILIDTTNKAPVEHASKLILSGGAVTNNVNTASRGGGGIGVWTPDCSLSITSGSTVTVAGNKTNSADNDIYMKGAAITISGRIADGSSIGVFTDTTPSGTADVKFAVGAEPEDAQFFFSDNAATAGVLYDDGTNNYFGNAVVSDAPHTHESNTLWLSVKTAGQIPVTDDFTNASLSAAQVTIATNYVAVITPDTGFDMPDSFTVSVSGTEYTVTAATGAVAPVNGNITYVPATRTLTVKAAMITKTTTLTVSGAASAQTYTLTLNKFGGTTNGSATATYGSNVLASYVPVQKTGYLLTGYFSAATNGVKVIDADGTLVSGAADYTDANGKWTRTSGAELYARWAANAYTVTLDPNGGALGSATSVQATYDSAMPALTTAGQLPTRTGYDFTGFFDSASGGVKQYYDSDGTSANTWDIADDADIFARWTPKTYTITLDKNGGTADSSTTVTFDASTLAAFAPVGRSLYSLTGYFTAADGGSMVINAAGRLVPDVTGYTDSASKWTRADNTKLYAQWTLDPTYGITLSQTGQYTFDARTFGINASPLTVTVSNSGNQSTGALIIELSGADAGSFTLSTGSISGIAAGTATTFDVAPKDSLTAGTYTATVTVKKAAGNPNAIDSQSFTVSFTVNPSLRVSISGNTRITKGSSTTLTANVTGGTGPYSYLWSGMTPAETDQSITVAPTQATRYSVTVTDSCGATDSFEVNVTMAAAPVLPMPGGAGDANVYNDAEPTKATIWLSGRGLYQDDLLITERVTSGSGYNAMRELANGGDVFRNYNIYLRSGRKSTGSAMYLHFDLSTKYAGQEFTLVHRKADSTYEYFYAVADSGGDLTFGPLYELSPFMLVKGRLSQAPVVLNARVPDTGDAPLLLLIAILVACAGLAAAVLRRRRQS